VLGVDLQITQKKEEKIHPFAMGTIHVLGDREGQPE